jgi:ABC-type lipopolysaccharide export system ATPase subunit
MSTPKRGPGRPSLTGERRDEIVRVRFSGGERRDIEAAAKVLGIKPAVWLHDAALHEIELQRARLRRRR